MSCEFINTNKCPFKEGVSTLRQNLGEIAEVFSAKQLREDVCNNPSDAARKEYCPIFKTNKP
jgi:hypothetical protein